MANTCPERQSASAENDKNEKKSNSKENSQNAFCAQGVGLLTVEDKHSWYVDSGATSPMSPYADVISQHKRASVAEIRVANDQRLKVNGMGDGEFMVNAGNMRITVNDILHVLDMRVNLLSVFKIVSHGNTVVFNNDGCKIFNKFDKLVASCKPENGIYKLILSPVKQHCLLSEQRETDALLWHRRYGHIGFQSLMRLQNSVEGISIKNDDSKIKQCKICPMGKQHRKPFKTSTTKTTKVLELVHSDLCGPMENKSLGNCRYMLTFTDDFSRKTFVYFLPDKQNSSLMNCLNRFVNLVQNKTESKIKKFRTDNGTEYVTETMKLFFDKCGYKHELTCTYTPQQNGVAERANRTLVERAKCMLFDAKLETKFWAEACNNAAYLMNRTPRLRLGNKTPEEMWCGRKPDVSHLKIFGSRVMVHVPKEKRTKWQTKSTEMLFLGNDAQKKGYRCFDSEKNRVIVSRDVQFFESLSSTVIFDLGEEKQAEERNYDSDDSCDGYQSTEGNFGSEVNWGDHTTEYQQSR